MTACRCPKPDGFTLLEVLVAFTIAGILLVALLRVFSGAIDSSRRTNAFSEATMIAESTLESIGASIPLRDGAKFERREGQYRVETSVRRYAPDTVVHTTHPAVVPYEIAVTVSWGEQQRDRSVALRTLHLAVPQ